MIQVEAEDRDAIGDPLNPAGQITYSIVSTHKNFKIDSETGWLSTNKVSQNCYQNFKQYFDLNVECLLIPGAISIENSPIECKYFVWCGDLDINKNLHKKLPKLLVATLQCEIHS